MRSTYKEEDVVLLLKDITGMLAPQSTEERERRIQSGTHYSEMLPREYVPTPEYMEAYREALRHYAAGTAQAAAGVAELVYAEKGRDLVLVSLARAGIPAGILMKHYLRRQYGFEVPHYGISIIRDRGIDKNAIRYLLKWYRPEQLQFVDGWIGKGAILRELERECRAFPGISPELAVLADPAGLTRLAGTREDLLIPSSCLNCTVSGLISRTVLRDDLIGADDFHGAVYYGEMEGQDLSYDFIHTVEAEFDGNSGRRETKVLNPDDAGRLRNGLQEVEEIVSHFGISDINFVKPGIGETTRVLLRRVPHQILIREAEKDSPMLRHLLRLAEEKQVPVEFYPLENYRACGIIRKCKDI